VHRSSKIYRSLLSGATPVAVRTLQGTLDLDVQEIERAIMAKTRFMIVNFGARLSSTLWDRAGIDQKLTRYDRRVCNPTWRRWQFAQLYNVVRCRYRQEKTAVAV